MSRCKHCAVSRYGCGGQGCSRTSTGGILDGLVIKAGDSMGARIAKDLGMFAILTSPAWILLLVLPKRQER